MITHDMGNAVPPVFGAGRPKIPHRIRMVDLELCTPDGKRHYLSTLIPNGTPVHEAFHDEYWCTHRMHLEYEQLFRKHSVPFPGGVILLNSHTEEVVGAIGFNPDDTAHDRSWLTCFAREIAAAKFGMQVYGALICEGDAQRIPEAEFREIAERTGASSDGRPRKIER